jgi:hypothetical protein
MRYKLSHIKIIDIALAKTSRAMEAFESRAVFFGSFESDTEIPKRDIVRKSPVEGRLEISSVPLRGLRFS